MTSSANANDGPDERVTKNSFSMSCELCDLPHPFKDELHYVNHILSKKHKSKQWRWRNNEALNQRGIQISNCGRVDLAVILVHFSKYGDITAIITGKSVLTRAEQQQQHKHHQQQQQMDKDKDNNSVVNLGTFFYYNFLYFKHRETATNLLRTCGGRIKLSGSVLHVSGSTVQQNRTDQGRTLQNVPSKYEAKHQEVISALKDKKTVEECMNALMETCAICDEEKRKKEELVEAVAKLFVKELKLEGPCQVEPFGSTASGLGFRGCDLDLYVNFDLPEEITVRMAKAKTESDRLREIQVKKVSLCSREIHKLSGAVNVVAIKSARVPIVKFTDSTTGISADISFRHQMSSRNTQFIRMVVTEIDKRIRPLVMTLRYWAKQANVTGNCDPQRMTNYSFAMLAIFYLQNKGLIPSVKSLQEMDGEKSAEYIQGWNVGFCTDAKLFPKTENQESLSVLLRDFFKFYSDFDFDTHIICPYLGRRVLKTDLSVDYSTRDESALTIDQLDLKPMRCNIAESELPTIKVPAGCACLQDPFELNRNCLSNYSTRTILAFRILCQYAASVCSRLVKQESDSANNQDINKFHLLDVFSKIPSQCEVKSILDERSVLKNIKERQLLQIPSKRKTSTEFVLNYEEKAHVKALKTSASGKCDVVAFFEEAEKLIEIYLVYCLMFEVIGNGNKGGVKHTAKCFDNPLFKALTTPNPDCKSNREEKLCGQDLLTKEAVVVEEENDSKNEETDNEKVEDGETKENKTDEVVLGPSEDCSPENDQGPDDKDNNDELVIDKSVSMATTESSSSVDTESSEKPTGLEKYQTALQTNQNPKRSHSLVSAQSATSTSSSNCQSKVKRQKSSSPPPKDNPTTTKYVARYPTWMFRKRMDEIGLEESFSTDFANFQLVNDRTKSERSIRRVKEIHNGNVILELQVTTKRNIARKKLYCHFKIVRHAPKVAPVDLVNNFLARYVLNTVDKVLRHQLTNLSKLPTLEK